MEKPFIMVQLRIIYRKYKELRMPYKLKHYNYNYYNNSQIMEINELWTLTRLRRDSMSYLYVLTQLL